MQTDTDRQLIAAHRDTLMAIEFAVGSRKRGLVGPSEALEAIRMIVEAHHERAREIIHAGLERKEVEDAD